MDEGSLKRVGEPRVKWVQKLVTAKTGSCDQLIYVNVKSGCRQSRNFKDLQSFCKWVVCGREMGGGVGDLCAGHP